MNRAFVLLVAGCLCTAAGLHGQTDQATLELDQKGQTIVLEPYAPNIVRVTLSLQHEHALAKPGYGFVASPEAAGWQASHSETVDVYRSSSLVATVERPHASGKAPLRTQIDIGKYFGGSTPGAHITFTTPDGKKLLEMTGWSQAVPNNKDGTASLSNDRRPTDPPFFVVGATFVSPDDEHYYGLGENQEGFLDHRGHRRSLLERLSLARPRQAPAFRF